MGNEIARQLANGMRQEWDRDVYGRVVAHRALRDGVLEGEQTFTWQAGHVVARTDSLRGAGEVWSYDFAGRTASIAFGYGETISYSYDARDRLVAEVYSVPGAGVIADIGHVYDGADRRIAIVDRRRGEPLVEWSFARRRARGDRDGQRTAAQLRLRRERQSRLDADARCGRSARRDQRREPRGRDEPAALRDPQRDADGRRSHAGALLAASGRVARESGPARREAHLRLE